MLATAARSKPWLVVALVSVLGLLLLFTFFSNSEYVPAITKLGSSSSLSPTKSHPTLTSSTWDFVPERDERNLGLTDEQCEIAFPEQYAEILRARDFHKSRGGIDEDQIRLWRNESDKAHGQLRILIYDGDLYVVGEKQGVMDRTRALDGISMIYRAITTVADPRTIPNVEFTVDRMDHPNPEPTREGRTVWAWTRHVKDEHTWIMPDFNGWASSGWDSVGGYRALREKTKHTNIPFGDKTPKLLWRGQLDVGMKVSPIRTALVEQSEDQPWNDVRAFRWGDGSDAPIPMEDHCLWQFLAHTEGNSWSGRLRNLVNCNSAILIHNPLQWMAHFYPVLKPDGPDQNYIPVKNDWSDLEETMDYYLAHPAEAERIAENNRRALRDRYMTPAAEACYIRRLIKEWATVQNYKPQLFKPKKNEHGQEETDKRKLEMRGVSWERFAYRPPKKLEHPFPGYPEGYWVKSDVVDFED